MTKSLCDQDIIAGLGCGADVKAGPDFPGLRFRREAG